MKKYGTKDYFYLLRNTKIQEEIDKLKKGKQKQSTQTYINNANYVLNNKFENEIFINGFIELTALEGIVINNSSLMEILSKSINNEQIKISYYISNNKKSYEQCQVEELNILEGISECKTKESWGSDLTGKYWHTDIFNIDKVDLVKRLEDNNGKYLAMKIEIQSRED
jgi:hypothetical protein